MSEMTLEKVCDRCGEYICNYVQEKSNEKD